ncbi:DUF4139 domain-containing protein [Streptomyces sp. B1I3]|uniref:DUF4139 domain-containing protein n=1 Tax=Streptomyces sp. B1I3 TaxID=3042264 RepID=UPI00278677DF|nr:DUF4139 domain-containing protein [Streptomyces sp. B1I3]MDQ0791849.1 hypothetical protein [Streptomyces sp. B1I3]
MTAEAVPRWGSTLDSVVVYEQGAVCRRLARGSVPPDGRVRVVGLPRSLDPGSLRARVLDAPGVRVSEARVEVEADPLGGSTPDGLRREVERLRDGHAAVTARRDHLLSLIEEVRALRPVPPARRREDAHRRTPVDAWLELAGFVDERLAGLHTRLGGVEEELRHAGRALDIAVDELARASTDAPSAHGGTTVSALVTVDASGPGAPAETGAPHETELELEYGVPGAVWVPAYRLAYRQGESSGRLVLRASVAQRSGEDWTGVSIALATADLRRGTGLPKLRSLRIGRRQPASVPTGWREPPAGLADLFAGYDAAGPRPATASAPAVAGPGPLPPPPPAPQGYGGPPAALPAPGGASPEPYTGHTPAAAQPARARTGGGRPLGDGPFAAPAPSAPAAPGRAAPEAVAGPPEPAAGPPQPSNSELDYSSLVLCGPDEQGGRRGRLFPGSAFDPVAAEHRRRAESVAALPLPGHAVRPRESAGSFDHRFDAAARTDVPSDGTWHTVTVGEILVGTHTEYLCTPSVEQTVYATSVLSNATGQALLAGPVEVTVDGDFLLTTALPTLAPGGVCRVGLGPAEGVRVTRRTHLRESTSGLRNNTAVLDHRVHVELANRLAGPVTLEVRERVPVTSDPDVRIEERADWTAPEDGPGPDRHVPGTRVWRVSLPSGGTTVLDGGYEIRMPAGKALVGGNRRS